MLQLIDLTTVLLVLPIASSVEGDTIPTAEFAAPMQLTAEGEPIRKYRYPSPTLYDVDNDGRRELVIGDLFGRVVAADPDGRGTDGEWHGLKPLEAEGEELLLNNW